MNAEMARLHAADMQACAAKLAMYAGVLGLAERDRARLLNEATAARQRAAIVTAGIRRRPAKMEDVS